MTEKVMKFKIPSQRFHWSRKGINLSLSIHYLKVNSTSFQPWILVSQIFDFSSRDFQGQPVLFLLGRQSINQISLSWRSAKMSAILDQFAHSCLRDQFLINHIGKSMTEENNRGITDCILPVSVIQHSGQCYWGVYHNLLNFLHPHFLTHMLSCT